MMMLPTPASPTPDEEAQEGGGEIMVGTFVKAKVGELGEGIREGFLRRSRKYITGVVQEVVGNRRYLVRF